MTIVASNSITVSNINDGTITHIAYAYSADGTDRFTTVYPNLNLLNGTSSTLRTTSANGWGYNYIKQSPNTLNLIKGQTLTYRVWIQDCDIDTRCAIYLYDSQNTQYNNLGNIIKAGTSGFSTVTFTIGSDVVKYTIGIGFTSYQSASHSLSYSRLKLDSGSTATPYMPSASEVTTADWPSYIGQYSDFTSTASTDPTKYAPWTIFKGNDGKDGTPGKDGNGIKTTDITYAISTSGTTAPNSGWTSSVPSLVNGQYFWAKTVWTYTDNSSKTGYSVTYISKDGSNGDPGKVVSDTEPTTRFKGLTWKYLGTSDLTASDGTVIHPNTEYYYNGTHWMINYLSANNLEANSITADLIDAKNLKITDGEFVSTIIDGSVQIQTEIKDDHLLIYKMDTSTNSINTIALKSDSGLGMTYQNSDTGEYTSAGVNFQGLFMQNNITNEFARLTPQGTKLSTDVPWTKLSLMNNFTGNIEYAIINGTVYISASGVGVPAMTAGQWKQAAQLPTGSSAIPIRANRITAGDSGDGLSWALLSNQAGGLFIRCSANKAATANLFNATLPYPIG